MAKKQMKTVPLREDADFPDSGQRYFEIHSADSVPFETDGYLDHLSPDVWKTAEQLLIEGYVLGLCIHPDDAVQTYCDAASRFTVRTRGSYDGRGEMLYIAQAPAEKGREEKK
jgi:hypothetical protein